MLRGLFGWRVAGLYIAPGLTMAILAGVIIGQLKLERGDHHPAARAQVATHRRVHRRRRGRHYSHRLSVQLGDVKSLKDKPNDCLERNNE